MNQADHLLRNEYIYAKGLSELNETYNTGVGFDLVKCKVYIRSVDWDTLNGLVKKSTGVIDYASEKIEDHIRYTLAGGNNKPLDIEGNVENGSYSSIMIEYRYFSLRLLSSNIKRKSDVTQLIVHVVPQNTILGNMNNYNVDALKNRVKKLIDFIKIFGIILNDKVATINYFELNRNYSYNSERGFISFFEAAFATLPDRFNIFPKEVPWGTLGVVDNTGIFANSSTVSVHVYNKLLETEDKTKQFLYIESPTVFRVEFVVKKTKQVESWLSVSNVFELKQEMADDAYQKYLKKYVLDLFDQQYKRFYNLMISDEYDTSNRHWTDEYARDLIIYAPKFHIDPMFIKINDIKNMLLELPSSTKTIKQNLSRCVKKIVNKTDGVVKENDYENIIKNLLLSPVEEYTIKYYYDEI